MNWWNVLEIPYDSDIKTIKKAYSRLLKIYNPEDDPEGYQKLREAYDKAKKYTKNNKDQWKQDVINNSLDKNNTKEVEEIKDKEYIPETYSNDDKHINFKPYQDINEIYAEVKETNLNINYQIMQFLNRLSEIYNDLYLRADAAVWDDLLNSDVMWNVDAFHIIEDELFNFLTKHPYLPEEIWIKLDNNFTWSQNEIKLYNKYSESMAHEFFINLKEPSKLKYDYIKSINPEIEDEYLYERQQAEKALNNKNYAKAYNHLKNANSLFEGDAELLRLKGDYEYNLEHLKTALEYYKSAFEINNNDLSSALRIGIILVSYKEFSEAIPYLSLYLSCNNNDKLALKYIAYAYYYNEEFIKAKENFQKLLCFDENNKIIKKYLINIEAQLVREHVRKITFDRDTLAKEEVVKKEKDSKTSSFDYKYPIKVISMIVILYMLRHSSVYKNSSNYNNAQNNKIYENINKDNKKVDNNENKNKETSKSLEKTILDPKSTSNVTLNLNNVKPTKYYKISEPFENRSIFSDTELQEKGLRDKVESQLYIGSTKENVVIFSDAKCSDKTIDKDGGYRIYGAVCAIDEEIGNQIRNEHVLDYAGFDWISNSFLDASKTKKNSKK